MKKTQDINPKELTTRGNTIGLHPIRLHKGAIIYKILRQGPSTPFASVKAILKPEILKLDPKKLQECLTTKLTIHFNKEPPFTQPKTLKKARDSNENVVHGLNNELVSPPRTWKQKLQQEGAKILGYGNVEASHLDGVCLESLISTTMNNEIEQDMDETTKTMESDSMEFKGNEKENSTPFETSKGIILLALIIIGKRKRQEFLEEVPTTTVEESGNYPLLKSSTH